MIGFKLKGAIFDVDDTLLNNGDTPEGLGLHDQSRLAAAHEVGRRHNIPQLTLLSVQTNYEAFRSAAVHTIEGAFWNTLVLVGLVDHITIDYSHPLLQELVALRNESHEEVLRRKGSAQPGAVEFVQALAVKGLRSKMAIASTARRREIDIFLEMTNLKSFFPGRRIISKESITHPKPNPQVFNLAFASIGLPETDRAGVGAFEDDPRGIMAAQAANLYTCAITTRYTREALSALTVPPDVIADSYQEFAKFFGIELP